MSSGHRLVFVSSVIVSLLALCSPAKSQSSDPVHIIDVDKPTGIPAAGNLQAPGRHTPGVLRVDAEMVLVPVTVTDGMNRPVMGLDKRNFALSESGQQQQIRSFSTEDSPISIGVLMDMSLSMKNKISTAREALGDFFDNSNPEDDYFVITFSNRPKLLADSTRSTNSIQNQLALEEPNGNTALLDAIYMGLTKLRSAKYQRRALFIISDGGDNHSRYLPKEIKSLVQEADVEIYAIGIFDSIFKTYEEWAGRRLLTEITEATGGRTITVDDVDKLSEAAATVSRELRSQYVLGYQPADGVHDAKFHKIKVQLAPPLPSAPLHVYNKKGYFARGN
jgi:Ca-activated chloride channel homolog